MEHDPIRGSEPQEALLKFAGQQSLASPKLWETEASTPIQPPQEPEKQHIEESKAESRNQRESSSIPGLLSYMTQ